MKDDCSTLAILVLYNLEIHQSATIKSLFNIAKTNPNIYDNLEIIIYDNSPDNKKVEIKEYKKINIIKYVSDPSNEGLAKAYNYALNYANEKNFKFLLLLDQDTKITNIYLNSLLRLVDDNTDNTVAYVPIMKSGNIYYSPNRVNKLGLTTPVIYSKTHLLDNVMCVNSCTTLNVSFLNEIKGFNILFPLDFLDHWIFLEINKRGKKVHFLQTEIEHDLSILNIKDMNIDRVMSIIDSEILFNKKYKSKFEYNIFKMRFILKVLKYKFLLKDKKLNLFMRRKVRELYFGI